VDQGNYTAQKAWKTLQFVMRVLKKKEIRIQKFILHVIGCAMNGNFGLQIRNFLHQAPTILLIPVLGSSAGSSVLYEICVVCRIL
jgi:hypothetical protein